jgi:hypothetical protein
LLVLVSPSTDLIPRGENVSTSTTGRGLIILCRCQLQLTPRYSPTHPFHVELILHQTFDRAKPLNAAVAHVGSATTIIVDAIGLECLARGVAIRALSRMSVAILMV